MNSGVYVKSRNPDINEALTRAGYEKQRPTVTLPHHSGLGVVATASDPVALRYAESALERQAGDLASVTEGSRNHETNRAAFKMGTLAGAGLLDADVAMAVLKQASMATGLSEQEAYTAVRSGFLAGIQRPRVVHLTATGYTFADTTFDPVTEIPQGSTETPSGNAGDGSEASQQPEAPRDIYARRVFTMGTAEDLPPIEWIVDQWLARESFARLVGASGSFKTFVTVDMALRVALGLPWQGKVTTRCKVHYMVGEGARGFMRRLRAWCDLNDVDHRELEEWFTFTNGVAAIGTPEWQGAVDWCEEWKAELIIGDTQSRLTPGFNENDNSDAKTVVDYVDRLKVRTQACVLLVHHTGHLNGDAGNRGRGASTFKDAADTEIILTRQGRDKRVTLLLEKAKDAEDKTTQLLDLVTVGESLAVSPEQLTTYTPEDLTPVDPLQSAVVDVLNGATQWITFNKIHKAIGGGRGRLETCLDKLVSAGLIVRSTDVGVELPNRAIGFMHYLP